MPKSFKWTDIEISFLKRNYLTMTDVEISKNLNRTPKSIEIKRHRLGLLINSDISNKRLNAAIVPQNGENNNNWKGGISKNHYHYKKIQKMRNPDKVNARHLVNKAIKSGKIVRMPCEVCGEIKSTAHHDDYKFPLSVRWLCRKHHRELHGNKH